VQERGRFTIPEEIRKVSKIEPGTLVVVEANRKEPGHIHVRVLQVKDEK
jgi:bifunctional DNA-binding transcriptional regulator/antitoxin component of YhaV-PrlF toxin-antitoxin module